MLELPEVLTLASQLNSTVKGKTVLDAIKPAKAGRFCFYSGDVALYGERLRGRTVLGASGFGIFAQIEFSGGLFLCVNDGTHITYSDNSLTPKNHQLQIIFDDGSSLIFSIVMYGGIYLHDGDFDNEYYITSVNAVNILSDGFGDYFMKAFDEAKPSMSAKEFLATKQRFSGLGNGCVQDILFESGLSPRHKLSDITPEQKEGMLKAVVSKMSEMVKKGGRDTQKDLFGNPGGYETIMSKTRQVCPKCLGPITRETYLGGSVYYCANCQK